jgi:hypothetical protein
MFGQNEQNTASNDEERKISPSNVATLAPKWVATTGGDVSARAAVVDRVVYFPDNQSGAVLTASPAVLGDVIDIGVSGHEDICDRSIDVQILRLRRKLELDPSTPQIIQTERGVGYVFTLPVERLRS